MNKNFLIKFLLIGGLQNMWQIGAVYPLNFLATFYFILKARFKIQTKLDMLILGYIITGIISLVSGLVLAMIDGASSELMLNAIKSFFVFMGVLVFFSAYLLNIEEFFRIAMGLFLLTAIAILISYILLYFDNSLSLTQTRSAISWCSGWPQRWIMFALVGYFVFLCRYDFSRKSVDLVFSLIFLSIILLSFTRSAALGLFAGHLVLSFCSRRDFFRTLLILAMIFGIGVEFKEEIQEAFRFSEIANYSSAEEPGSSSMNNRTLNLWPGILRSLEISRLPFGWGHVGLAYIPHEFFNDRSLLSDIPGEQSGSAESQYMDVLLRQGIVGLAFYLSILICGLNYSYRLYKLEINSERQYLWKAAIAWQIAIIIHGITVETTRLSLYSLFFFLFLGASSRNYSEIKKYCSHNTNSRPLLNDGCQ